MKTKTNSTFKKSVLSFFVVSAVAGAFIPWENYIPRSETPEVTAFYENRDEINDLLFVEDLNEFENATLANLTEHNLVAALDAEVDAQIELNIRTFAEQDHSPEADEVYDEALEHQQLASIELEDKVEPLALVSLDDTDTHLILDTPVLFAYDSSEIKPEYFQLLNETARYMEKEEQENNTVWHVIGYADLSGNYIYNSKLAKKRAQNVAAYLVDKGVGEAQLSIASLGSSKPINNERTVENNRNERRVEIQPYQTKLALSVKDFNHKIDKLEAIKVAKETNVEESLKAQEVTNIERDTEIILVEEDMHNKEIPTLEKELTERLTTAMEL